MRLMSLVLLLLLVWTAIHGTHYLWRQRKSTSILPGAAPFGQRRQARSAHWQLVLDKLHLRVQTTAWNEPHDALARNLRPSTRLGAFLTTFYNVGVLAGFGGSAVALGLLSWSCLVALGPWVHATLATPTTEAGQLARRAFEAVATSANENAVVKPIIPGITTPLSHLPPILIAVFFSQLVHELGHAIAAALDAVPILTAGASFTVAVPAAFVTFPNTAMSALRPWARARIIAAGPFHNLVFWLFLLLVDRVGVSRMLYRDATGLGRVVVDIDEDSDLWNHLALGSLITKVDDVELASAEDRWTEYLTLPSQPGLGLGWCASRVDFDSNPRSCCESAASSSLLTCFSSPTSRKNGCLDAISILSNETRRCQTDDDCGSEICVHPHESAQIVRLTVQTNAQPEIVLWSGPKREIYEQVQVGTAMPRLGLFRIYRVLETFWMYIKLATLSLYLFNLLPLPYLDGTQFMQACLDMALPETAYEEYDIEALEAATERRGRERGSVAREWKRRLIKAVPIGTSCIFILSTLLSVVK